MWTTSKDMPAPAGERRRAARYPVAVEITFDGGTGQTVDISANGVCFTTTAALSAGTRLVFRIAARHFQMASPMAVQCRCCVVRVRSRGSHWEVAASIDGIEFDSAQET